LFTLSVEHHPQRANRGGRGGRISCPARGSVAGALRRAHRQVRVRESDARSAV